MPSFLKKDRASCWPHSSRGQAGFHRHGSTFDEPPYLVSCTGATHRTIVLLDQCPYANYGIQSPPHFEELSLKTLMHKKVFSVFGKIDFFSVLQFIVVCLGSSLDLDWVLMSPELSKVIMKL